MTDIAGQKAIVTGRSSGQGLGVVEALVEQKALVTVVARNAERLTNVSTRLGVKVIQGDVTDEKLARGSVAEPWVAGIISAIANVGKQTKEKALPNPTLLHEAFAQFVAQFTIAQRSKLILSQRR